MCNRRPKECQGLQEIARFELWPGDKDISVHGLAAWSPVYLLSPQVLPHQGSEVMSTPSFGMQVSFFLCYFVITKTLKFLNGGSPPASLKVRCRRHCGVDVAWLQCVAKRATRKK